MDQERKRGRIYQVRKSGIKHLHQFFLEVSIFMCDFLARYGMHGYACVLLVLLLSLACVFLGVIVFISLSLPFPDSHGVMEFSCFS